MNNPSKFSDAYDNFEQIVAYQDARDGCSAFMPLLVDVAALAAMLSISIRTAYRLVELGELPQPLHIGRLARWRIVDVVAFVDLLREQAALSTTNPLRRRVADVQNAA